VLVLDIEYAIAIKQEWNKQSNLYSVVTFGTMKKWPYKTGDLLKEVQFI